MRIFVGSIQAQVELYERPFKAMILKTYLEKSHIDFYYFVSNIRIILRHQTPLKSVISYLPPHFSGVLLTSDGLSTSTAIQLPFQSRGLTLKSFFEKTLEIFSFLQTTFKVNFKRIFSTS